MYISRKNKEIIKNKFFGKCAYSGTALLSDWQIDHVDPVRRNWWNNTCMNEKNHTIENMVPCQKIINHYKHSYPLEYFRKLILTLHVRIAKLPKNPKTEKSKKHKTYMLELAGFFGVTADRPFSGKFYFENYNQEG
jgi:hypothetical protein